MLSNWQDREKKLKREKNFFIFNPTDKQGNIVDLSIQYVDSFDKENWKVFKFILYFWNVCYSVDSHVD